MVVNREMIHDIVKEIPESEIIAVYSILTTYLYNDEEVLTEKEEARMKEGFDQIARGDSITLEEYRKKRAARQI